MKYAILQTRDILFAIFFGSAVLFTLLSIIAGVFHRLRSEPRWRDVDLTNGVPKPLTFILFVLWIVGAIGGLLCLPAALLAGFLGPH